MADLIASSANILQCNFTGGRLNSFAIFVFFIDIASSICFPFTHSVANDDEAITQGRKFLMHSAGNFYINDKPTGAVVGQQPFGGSRASGTNDKAGAPANLLRWTSQRTVKQTFEPPVDYKYPFMEEE